MHKERFNTFFLLKQLNSELLNFRLYTFVLLNVMLITNKKTPEVKFESKYTNIIYSDYA